MDGFAFLAVHGKDYELSLSTQKHGSTH